MSESINALMQAKEQGVKDFDALPDKVHTELDTLATQINEIEASVNKTRVEKAIEQAELLNKGYLLFGENHNTFGAWFIEGGNISTEIAISAITAHRIIHLAKFARGKNVTGLNLAVLYTLAQPKWVKAEKEDDQKALQKALSNAYRKISRWVPRKQTAPNATACIIEERRKLGYAEPAKPTAYSKPVELSDVKDTLSRNFNDYRMNFQVNEGELEELANYVDDLMDEWVPDRRQKALPAPLIDIESGFTWIDTLEQQDIRDLIAYAQEKLDA